MQAAIKAYGKIDYAVNNAGIEGKLGRSRNNPATILTRLFQSI
jgi:NAD(P)-dependent dehydrogenase (short-subunit alcohol dehydrogenase family)